MVKKLVQRVVVALVVLAWLLATPAAASGAAQEEIPTFDGWLQDASGPLVSLIVGVMLSWLVEYWPAYEAWPAKYKRLVYFGICIIIPTVAACLRAGLGYVAWSFDPLIWHALWNGFAAAGAGTVAHTRKL